MHNLFRIKKVCGLKAKCDDELCFYSYVTHTLKDTPHALSSSQKKCEGYVKESNSTLKH